MPKIIVKKPGEDMRVEVVDAKYRNELSRFFDEGTYLEYVNWGTERVPFRRDGESVFAFACDDAGLCKDLPTNFYRHTPVWGVQPIAGTVVFFRYKWEDAHAKELWDYELQDVTEDDVSQIAAYLSERIQLTLRMIGGL